MDIRTLKSTKFRFLVAACILFLVSATVEAQASRANTALERRVDTMNRQAREYDRESLTRDVKGKNAAETAKRKREVLVEIEEDLKALQLAYNNAIMLVKNSSQITNEFRIATGKGVERAARRLKANLALPEPKEAEIQQPDSQANNQSDTLTELCRKIYSLVTNPLFENSTGLDLDLAVKARRDIESLIELSSRLTTEIANQPK
ncbi:MAG TPA: hypothetical protein PKD26_09520 [Pyrinomonadaceae bacterium]|nr:hypothetical protein [Pyrinomonadaceae bacterium]